MLAISVPPASGTPRRYLPTRVDPRDMVGASKRGDTASSAKRRIAASARLGSERQLMYCTSATSVDGWRRSCCSTADGVIAVAGSRRAQPSSDTAPSRETLL